MYLLNMNHTAILSYTGTKMFLLGLRSSAGSESDEDGWCQRKRKRNTKIKVISGEIIRHEFQRFLPKLLK